MPYKFVEVKRTTRFAPKGVCIYCGTSEALSDEHIVPLGLGGNLVLPKSSCSTCSRITSQFEGRVLRGFMLPARSVAGLPTRRPKQRPMSFQLQVLFGQRQTTLRLPAVTFPALLHLPVFEPAAILSGRVRKAGISVCGIETIRFGANPIHVIKALAARGMRQTASLDVIAFARMIAKIGYSYAVATEGPVSLSQVGVLPLIRGLADDAGTWVGSAQFSTVAEARGALHSLSMLQSKSTSGERLPIARVKLFTNSGASGYEVVLCAGTPSFAGRRTSAA